jgi:hypothetical protein
VKEGNHIIPILSLEYFIKKYEHTKYLEYLNYLEYL